MTATAAAEKPKSRKEKTRQVSNMPFKDYLRLRMDEAGLSNVDLAEAIGYPRGNVIAMMKSGDMRLPLNKVKPTAKALGVDPVVLFQKVITETDIGLWETIQDIVGDHVVSANEQALIDFVRKELDGHDVNLMKRPEFVQTATTVIREIVEREKAMSDATLTRLAMKR